MSKITRETMLVFASNAGANQIAEFGSLADGAPVYVIPGAAAIAAIQSLSNYLEGWYGGVVGSNLPAKQDLNALCYLYAYQLAYIFQAGVPEWDSGTTYYTGSIVQSAGVLYTSLQDANLNNTVSTAAYWQARGSQATFFTQNGSWTCPAGVTNVKVISTRKRVGLQRASGLGCFVDAPGNAYMFGLNTNGGLGIGNQTPKSSPVLVLGGIAFDTVYSDDQFAYSIGLASNGLAYGWGLNSGGQLGVGDTNARSSPVLIAGLTFYRISELQEGSFCLGITSNGNMYSWGVNATGALGIGSTTGANAPTLVLGGLKWWKAEINGNASAGNTCSYGITTSGAMYAWGFNSHGELGVGDVTPRSSPIAVLGGLTFQKVAAGVDTSGNNYTVGLTTAGAIYAWGSNVNGQLGVGDVTPRSSPVAVLGGLTFADFRISGEGSVYGLTAVGVGYAWGANINGELGVGDTTSRSSPVAVLGGLTFQKLVPNQVYGASGASAYGLTTAGALYAWGGNTSGQLGVGDVTPRSSPVVVLGGLTFYDIQPVSSNSRYIARAVAINGDLYCWGDNPNGQLGVGDVTQRSSPVLALAAASVNILPDTTTTVLTVVPGNVYTVTLRQYFATLGVNVVGKNVESIAIEYAV